MDLYIAEKPELARAIKEALSGNEIASKGYFTKGDNIVTYAIGHVLELYKPDDYDDKYKNWSFDTLPIQINEYKYKPKESTKEQLKIVCSLINDNRVSRIIHCGDADDEGQILIEEILNYAKNKKPVMRVLINDLTKEAIQKEIANMKPNSEFKNMSDRGFARSIADWEVGMNLSRAYTLAYRQRGGEGVISVGRVQTPILALIVNRDYENSNFKSKDYFAIKGSFELNGQQFTAPLLLDKDERIEDENKANDIKNSSVASLFGVSVSMSNKTDEPPLPFNLLTLQALASKMFGFSAKKTLQVTQELREKHKAISYNRSDCEYLPTTAFENATAVLQAVNENIGLDISKADTSYKNRAFDDSKLSAHYGIIPTKAKFDKTKLSEDELNIYELIAKRFLMQFFHPCEYISYQVVFNKDDVAYKTTLRRNIKLGYKEFFGNSSDDENTDELINTDLMSLNGANATCQDVTISREKTKPRPLYTMTSLLKDLNSVAKYVTNDKIKKLLLEKDKEKKGENGGIGTPATRSDMIEKLITSGYIEVSKDKKQQIKSTLKGQNLIKCVSSFLSAPDMTALWYEYQKEIEAGNRTKENFLFSVKNDIKYEIERIKDTGEFKMEVNNSGITCPKCNNGVLVRKPSKKDPKRFWWGCSCYPACDAVYFDNNGEPQLEERQKAVRDKNSITCPKCNDGFLIERKGKTGFVFYGCSNWKKDGSGCDGSFKKDSNGNLVPMGQVERPANAINCPKCNKGFLREFPNKQGTGVWYGCSEYKNGCQGRFVKNQNGEFVEFGN